MRLWNNKCFCSIVNLHVQLYQRLWHRKLPAISIWYAAVFQVSKHILQLFFFTKYCVTVDVCELIIFKTNTVCTSMTQMVWIWSHGIAYHSIPSKGNTQWFCSENNNNYSASHSVSHCQPLSHSVTHSVSHSLTHSLTHSIIHWLTHTVSHLVSRSVTVSHSVIQSLSHSVCESLSYSIGHSINHSLCDALTVTQSIAHSVTHSNSHSVNRSLSHSPAKDSPLGETIRTCN